MAAFSRRRLAQVVVDRFEQLPYAQVMQELAAFLVEERRVNQLELLIRDIETEYAARGHVVGNVTTAHGLSTESRAELEAFIQTATGAKTVELREHVDADIIGGVIVQTPGQYLDSSIATQLQRLKTTSA